MQNIPQKQELISYMQISTFLNPYEMPLAKNMHERMNTQLNEPVRKLLGRNIAQVGSRWHPTAAARVRSQVKSCRICGKQSGAGAGFLRVLRFPLPILITPTAPHSASNIRGWYNRPVDSVSPHLKKLK
jgi:hypothetical protein